MELIRMSLAGIMALLVSMPFGLCNEDCHLETCPLETCQQNGCHQSLEVATCSDSCCAEPRHPEPSQTTVCDCNCTGDCQALHFEQHDYVASATEVSAPEAPEQPADRDEMLPGGLLMTQQLQGGVHLRAPPDLFARSSRQVIHCVFRW